MARNKRNKQKQVEKSQEQEEMKVSLLKLSSSVTGKETPYKRFIMIWPGVFIIAVVIILLAFGVKIDLWGWLFALVKLRESGP